MVCVKWKQQPKQQRQQKFHSRRENTMSEQNADVDDDIPQLEDMSEELERLKSLRTHVNRSNEQPQAQTSSSKPLSSLTDHDKKMQGDVVSHKGESTKKKSDQQSPSFGGFKKGFLFSSSDSKSRVNKTQKCSVSPSSSVKGTAANTQDSADIPLIKPKQKDKSNLEFPEVQEAMKESFPLLQSQDWVTDDLLSKIHDNPILSESFSDPSLSQALTQFQSNPKAALAAAKDNPKVQKFLQEFCSLMGDHFTLLADKEEKKQTSNAATEESLISEVPSNEEETKMREILSRPQVKEALSDPDIQKLIVALKEDPTAAQRLLHSDSGDFRRKVKTLVDNGLVDFHSF